MTVVAGVGCLEKLTLEAGLFGRSAKNKVASSKTKWASKNFWRAQRHSLFANRQLECLIPLVIRNGFRPKDCDFQARRLNSHTYPSYTFRPSLLHALPNTAARPWACQLQNLNICYNLPSKFWLNLILLTYTVKVSEIDTLDCFLPRVFSV